MNRIAIVRHPATWALALFVASTWSGCASGREIAGKEASRAATVADTSEAVTVPARVGTPVESPVIEGPLARRMDDFIRRASAFGFDGQVLVEKGGRVILHQAYGWADRADARAMTVNTPIGIASMSKQLVAAAVLALEEDGRLSVHDRLDRWVDGLPDTLAAATLHELLTHTSGLRPGDPMGDFEVVRHEEALRRFATWPVLQPRARWRYANVGYNLLAEAIEAAAGMPYERYLARRLFGPAGMHRTGFWHAPPVSGAPPAHAYRGPYDTGTPLEWPRNYRVRGAGDVLSTAADLHRWQLSLREGTTLSATAAARAAAPQASIDAERDLSYGYGLFVLVEEDGDTLVEHGGDWQGGYNGVTIHRSADSVFIAVVSSARDGNGQWTRHWVQRALDRLATGESLPEAVAPLAEPLSGEEGAALQGGWKLRDGGRLDFSWDGTRMWVRPTGDSALALLYGEAPPDSTDLLASVRTAALLRAIVSRGPSAAFAEALGADGAPHLPDYLAEWEGVEAEHGKLRDWEVLGSGVVHGSPGDVHVNLQLEGGAVPMTFFWSDAGSGRLAGTFVRDAPNMEPLLGNLVVASDGRGGLVAHDGFRDATARFRLTEDGLEVLGSGRGGPVLLRRSDGAAASRIPR